MMKLGRELFVATASTLSLFQKHCCSASLFHTTQHCPRRRPSLHRGHFIYSSRATSRRRAQPVMEHIDAEVMGTGLARISIGFQVASGVTSAPTEWRL